MNDKRIDEATYGSGRRNAESGQSSDRQKLKREPFVDPAEEAMRSNPNPSPPIVPHPN